jgi:hypothetical protein
MLTPTEAADIPAEMANQRTIAALGLTINQYMKTLQGRQMVESQDLFILAGKVYQGYDGKVMETTEDQIVETEIENAHDIDGSKQRVLDTRKRRLEGAALSKKRELAQRRKAEIATERDALELIKLRREMGALDPDDPAPEPEPSEPQTFTCDCGASFDSANRLKGHKMGAKH